MGSCLPTNWGLFEPLVMFFGLTNSLATFQTMMNNIFKGHIDEGYVAVLRVAHTTRVLRKSRPEIRKFGGFLELASAHALRLPSVTSRVFRMEVRIEFPECTGTEKCTGMVPGTSTKTREAEVRSTYSSEVRGMREVGFSLSEESSRTRQDTSRV